MRTIGSDIVQIRELPTPVGLLQIAATDHGIVSILFTDDPNNLANNFSASHARTQAPKLSVLTVLTPAVDPESMPLLNCNSAAEAHLAQAIMQLQQYFAGQRQQFSLTLVPVGSRFQQQVWQALCAIPFAHSCSYGAIANHLHNPKAVRAVGAANGRNPIAIVVPCHRVIGANGSLTGYAGGLNRKLWLLQHELDHATKVT